MGYDPNQVRDYHGRWGSDGLPALGSSHDNAMNEIRSRTEKWTKENKIDLKSIADRSQISPLNQSENSAIDYYRYMGHNLNSYLRRPNRIAPNNSLEVNSHIKNLDSAIQKFSLSDDVEVYRAVPGSVQRLIASKSNGTETTDRAFVSTTINKAMVDIYAELNEYSANIDAGPQKIIKINVPRNTRVIPWLNRDIDHEFLLGRGTRFKIIDKDRLEVLR